MSYQCQGCAGLSLASWREIQHAEHCTLRGQALVVRGVVGPLSSDPLYTMGLPDLSAPPGLAQLRSFADAAKAEAVRAIDSVVEAYERAARGVA